MIERDATFDPNDEPEEPGFDWDEHFSDHGEDEDHDADVPPSEYHREVGHAYVSEGVGQWRTCAVCGRGANAATTSARRSSDSNRSSRDQGR